jgi:tRNA 2-selenouridine synthase
VVQALLTEHYDPVYVQSMKRNFEQYEISRTITPQDHTQQAMQKLAQEINAEKAE